MKGHLVLTRQTRRCRSCGEPTRWALESDVATERGLCLGHPSTPFERGEIPTARQALALLVRVLGVDAVWTAPPARPNGPCARCGTWIVRYGPDAVSTLCGPCGGRRD